MDALEQLHATQQRARRAIDDGSWGDVAGRLQDLTTLDERALWPALRDLAVRDHTLTDARGRHRTWQRILDDGDDPAARAALADSLAGHITWTGAEVLAVLCRSLSDDRFDRLGARMAALVVPRPAPRPALAAVS